MAIPQYCPACGYDQRGLRMDAVCPECGSPQDPDEAARVNQWVDHALVDLWGVAAFQLVGIAFGSVALVFVAKGHSLAGMVVTGACLFVFAALAWFTMILVGFLRRRSTYNFLNVAPWRRRQLSRWLWLDSALLLVPSLGYYLSKAI